MGSGATQQVVSCALVSSAHLRIAVITVIRFSWGIHFENLDFLLRRDYRFPV